MELDPEEDQYGFYNDDILEDAEEKVKELNEAFTQADKKVVDAVNNMYTTHDITSKYENRNTNESVLKQFLNTDVDEQLNLAKKELGKIYEELIEANKNLIANKLEHFNAMEYLEDIRHKKKNESNTNSTNLYGKEKIKYLYGEYDNAKNVVDKAKKKYDEVLEMLNESITLQQTAEQTYENDKTYKNGEAKDNANYKVKECNEKFSIANNRLKNDIHKLVLYQDYLIKTIATMINNQKLVLNQEEMIKLLNLQIEYGSELANIALQNYEIAASNLVASGKITEVAEQKLNKAKKLQKLEKSNTNKLAVEIAQAELDVATAKKELDLIEHHTTSQIKNANNAYLRHATQVLGDYLQAIQDQKNFILLHKQEELTKQFDNMYQSQLLIETKKIDAALKANSNRRHSISLSSGTQKNFNNKPTRRYSNTSRFRINTVRRPSNNIRVNITSNQPMVVPQAEEVVQKPSKKVAPPVKPKPARKESNEVALASASAVSKNLTRKLTVVNRPVQYPTDDLTSLVHTTTGEENRSLYFNQFREKLAKNLGSNIMKKSLRGNLTQNLPGKKANFTLGSRKYTVVHKPAVPKGPNPALVLTSSSISHTDPEEEGDLQNSRYLPPLIANPHPPALNLPKPSLTKKQAEKLAKEEAEKKKKLEKAEKLAQKEADKLAKKKAEKQKKQEKQTKKSGTNNRVVETQPPPLRSPSPPPPLTLRSPPPPPQLTLTTPHATSPGRPEFLSALKLVKTSNSNSNINNTHQPSINTGESLALVAMRERTRLQKAAKASKKTSNLTEVRKTNTPPNSKFSGPSKKVPSMGFAAELQSKLPKTVY